jgi:hypothetical protein
MDQTQFDACAVLLRGYTTELQATAEDCVTQATHLIAGSDPDGQAGPSPEAALASLVLNRLRGQIEQVMAAYDRLQESVGGSPRYQGFLEQLTGTLAEGASSPGPSG